MSSPGGPDNPYGQQYGSQYYDPITGQPTSPGQPTNQGSFGYGYQQPREWQAQQGYPPYQGDSYGSSSYRGFGYFDQQAPMQAPNTEAPSGGRSKAPLIATLSVTLAGIIAVVTTLILVNGSDERAIPATPSEGAPTSSAPATSTTAPSSTSSTLSAEPVIPGWRVVTLPRKKVAYDLPPGWVRGDGIAGFETEDGRRVSVDDHAIYRENFCAEASYSFRGLMGFTSAKSENAEEAADGLINQWAEVGWTSADGTAPKVRISAPKPASPNRGWKEAKLISGTITPAKQGPCDSPTVYIAVMALPRSGGTDMMLAVADQKVPGAVPPSTIDKALTSLRPVGR